MDRRHFHLKVIAATGTLAAGVYVSAVQPPRPTFLFEKTGKVVLSRGPSGSFDSTPAKYPCVLKVNDLWMRWYSGRTDDGFTGSIGYDREQVAAALGPDGSIKVQDDNGALTWRVVGGDGWKTGEPITFFWQSTLPPEGTAQAYTLRADEKIAMASGPFPPKPEDGE